jgi:hypothetical protein
MHPRLCMHEHFDLFTNSSKYKCEPSQIFTSISKNYDDWKMQFMNSGSNTLKVNDSIHVQMLIVQKMQKNSLTHLYINVKH